MVAGEVDQVALPVDAQTGAPRVLELDPGVAPPVVAVPGQPGHGASVVDDQVQVLAHGHDRGIEVAVCRPREHVGAAVGVDDERGAARPQRPTDAAVLVEAAEGVGEAEPTVRDRDGAGALRRGDLRAPRPVRTTRLAGAGDDHGVGQPVVEPDRRHGHAGVGGVGAPGRGVEDRPAVAGHRPGVPRRLVGDEAQRRGDRCRATACPDDRLAGVPRPERVPERGGRGLGGRGRAGVPEVLDPVDDRGAPVAARPVDRAGLPAGAAGEREGPPERPADGCEQEEHRQRGSGDEPASGRADLDGRLSGRLPRAEPRCAARPRRAQERADDDVGEPVHAEHQTSHGRDEHGGRARHPHRAAA